MSLMVLSKQKRKRLFSFSTTMANEEGNDWINSIPFELTETDRQNLIAGDEKFVPHTWEELKHIIGSIHYLSR